MPSSALSVRVHPPLAPGRLVSVLLVAGSPPVGSAAAAVRLGPPGRVAQVGPRGTAQATAAAKTHAVGLPYNEFLREVHAVYYDPVRQAVYLLLWNRMSCSAFVTLKSLKLRRFPRPCPCTRRRRGRRTGEGRARSDDRLDGFCGALLIGLSIGRASDRDETTFTARSAPPTTRPTRAISRSAQTPPCSPSPAASSTVSSPAKTAR